MSSTACLVVAAGAGARLAAGRPKAFVEVGGATLLVRAVAAVLASGCADIVVAVVPAELVATAETLLPPPCRVVAGGATRADSVSAGLRAIAAGDLAADDLGAGAVGHAATDVVLVHDAARCFAPAEQVRRVHDAVRAGHPVVVPAVSVHDTVRRVDAAGPGSELVDRERLRAVQTPQGFLRSVLEAAHASGGASATDDATLAERLGHPVHLVEGSAEAFKITGPLDLALAEALAGREVAR